jgi:hypothetical protein
MWTCNVCGGTTLLRTEYRAGQGVVAPALACADCAAISLDESVAECDEERESVKLAKAARAAAVGDEPND